jgi:hypothetical protein
LGREKESGWVVKVKVQRAVLPSRPGELISSMVSGINRANARFNRLAWSAPSANHPKGVIAAGMETGEVHVYDPEKIMAGKRYSRFFVLDPGGYS